LTCGCEQALVLKVHEVHEASIEVQPKADAVLREQEQERKTLTVQPKQMAKNKD